MEEHRLRVEAVELTGNPKEGDHLRIATASSFCDVCLSGNVKQSVYWYVGDDLAKHHSTVSYIKSFWRLQRQLYWEQLLHKVQRARAQKETSKAGTVAMVRRS